MPVPATGENEDFSVTEYVEKDEARIKDILWQYEENSKKFWGVFPPLLFFAIGMIPFYHTVTILIFCVRDIYSTHMILIVPIYNEIKYTNMK